MPDQQKHNRLAGKRVLVLGGTSGIGYGAAEASLESGATVIISSSNQSRVESSVGRLQSAYPSRKADVSGHKCDLGSDDTLESSLVQLLDDATDKQAKKLDHIVFSAADSLVQKELKEFDLKAIQAAGRVRFFAPMLLAKHAVDYVNPGRKSSMTITTGGVAERPIPKWTVIASYASGHYGMIRGLALDLAPFRVNGVSPGLVDTELWKDLDPEKRAAIYKSTADSCPTGAVAQPADVAEAYLYLMKDYNTTGSIVQTDSGHHLV